MSIKRTLITTVVGAWALTAGHLAYAQQTSATTATEQPPTGGVPDEVRLRGGGLVRGTIAEQVPGGEVVIVTLTGEVRRFPMSDVEYAGPRPQPPARSGSAAPTTPEANRSSGRVTSQVAAQPQEARVRFEANQPNVSLLRLTGTGSATLTGSWTRINARHYETICTAPCTATFEPGAHTLALSLGNRAPVELEEPLVIQRDGRVEGIYHSRQALRVAGWVTWGASLIAGSIMMTANMKTRSVLDENNEPNYGLTIGGAVVIGVGCIAGAIMAFAKDKADAHLTAY